MVLVAFLFAGKWLDDRLGTEPWLLMAGVFVGFGLSVYWMYRRLTSGGGEGR
ncbi:MAG: AtpZ/AtpI family protein [Gemmatimonadetes bacterium]|nr:AtpZ/AtpI family protein [Gemmatimonadota bacterium]